MRLALLLAPSFYLCVKSKGKVLTGCNDCISTHDDIIYPKVVFFSELCPGRGLSCDHLSSVQIDISILYIAVDISILHTAVYKQLTYPHTLLDFGLLLVPIYKSKLLNKDTDLII